MQPLDPEFVARCTTQQGFRLRGLQTTRIETFVDAAFAFAVTLLVISFDAIPRNWDEVVLAVKSIPAFVVAVAQLVWIWYEHMKWSRRYGLEDAMTVFLSAVLLIVVLVYIYPLRMMAGGMFAWMTNNYLPQSFDLQNWDQLAGMFVFMGTCFAVLCGVFALFYAWAGRRAEPLRLSDAERFDTRSARVTWTGSALVGLLSAGLAVALPPPWTPFAGFAYGLLGVWVPVFNNWRWRRRPAQGA